MNPADLTTWECPTCARVIDATADDYCPVCGRVNPPAGDEPEYTAEDRAADEFWGELIQGIRRDIVRKLLAADGAKAFTTRAYIAAYSAAWKHEPHAEITADRARSHLRHCGIVRELVPDIWVPVAEAK